MLSIILCVVLLSALGPSVEGDRGPDRLVKPCLRPCTKILAPVCAIPVGFTADPRTFSNECVLHNYNCENRLKYKFSYEGVCNNKCNEICTADYDPICAVPVSGCGCQKEFGNKCKLELYNCRNPKDQYKPLHRGPCRNVLA